MKRCKGVWLLVALLVATVGLCCSKVEATEQKREKDLPLYVAVAANFAAPIDEIAKAFEASSGQAVEVTAGSTGKLHAQIENGAPFHIFLAADEQRPALLEKKGLALAGSRFTYAVGRLALCGSAFEDALGGPGSLQTPMLKHLAIANPKIAPYGLAAKEVLEKLSLWEELESRVVQGENIAQVYQFANSGAAELAFVAFSFVADLPKERYWLVPESYHSPIRQDGVLLDEGKQHPKAAAFIEFMKRPEARAMIESAGYRAP